MLYLLRSLRSFGVGGQLLRTYQSVVSSAMSYAVVCWGSSITDRDTDRLTLDHQEGRLSSGREIGRIGDGGREADAGKGIGNDGVSIHSAKSYRDR